MGTSFILRKNRLLLVSNSLLALKYLLNLHLILDSVYIKRIGLKILS